MSLFAAVGDDIVWGIPGSIGAPDATIVVNSARAERAPDVRFAVLGDVGTGEEGEWATAGLVTTAAAEDPFEGLLLLGDNVYPNGDPARLGATVFEPFGAILEQGTGLLPVLGNHDIEDGHASGQIAALEMPGRWYATEAGPALIIGLDSNLVEDAAQLEWLEATLSAADAPWIIVAMHHPPYSAGSHGSDKDVREAWVPLFERYEVDLVLAGHDHDYQRSEVINGVTYVVSGAGAKLRRTNEAEFTAYAASVLHWVDIGIWDDRMEVTAYSAAGPFDHLVLGGSGS